MSICELPGSRGGRVMGDGARDIGYWLLAICSGHLSTPRLAVSPADHVAPTSGDHRSPRRPLSPRRRVRQLADGPERAGDIRPLHTFGAVRGTVSPDRGTRAGAELRP